MVTPLQILIPVPTSFIAVLFMAFGVLFWLAMLFQFLSIVLRHVQKKEPDRQWNPTKHDFEPVTVRNSIPTWIVVFLLGSGFFVFGYLTYTDLLFPLLCHNAWLIIVFPIAFLVIVYLARFLLLRREGTRDSEENRSIVETACPSVRCFLNLQNSKRRRKKRISEKSNGLEIEFRKVRVLARAGTASSTSTM